MNTGTRLRLFLRLFLPLFLPLLIFLLPTIAWNQSGIRWGINGGLSPLHLSPGEPDLWIPSQGCGDCHREQHQHWSASGHQSAWSGAVMQAGFIAEPLEFCIHCHAPLPAQKNEIKQNLPWYWAQRPQPFAPHPSPLSPTPNLSNPPIKSPEPLANEGVNCVACHWRDGAILTPDPVREAPHPTRHAPELSQSEFCIQCHEFNMARTTNGQLQLTEIPMQTTGTEWRDWQKHTGQTERCQDCHMPDRAHTFRGGYDQAWLRQSIQITLTPQPSPRTTRRTRSSPLWTATLSLNGVGHAFPTGDIFRHLTLEVQTTDTPDRFQTLHWIGKQYSLTMNEDTGHLTESLALDNRLQPTEVRTIPLPLTTQRWRLSYHYGSQTDLQRGLLPENEWSFIIAEGQLPSP